MSAGANPVPLQHIHGLIYLVRGAKVMRDSDLAELYGVATKVLNQAVKRNRERFPEDFMFQVDSKEAAILRSQVVTSSSTWGGRRRRPYVFTEQGVEIGFHTLRETVDAAPLPRKRRKVRVSY
ncbi:MAG: hypothetical protein DME22_14840 [Verrucomicrobia bacterium]|nr:MAG: hypothetical protein DME22_14840 [Verrucomicrobiota bacterium]PYK01472.1 MAG: hypothetical protein DME23_04060 [Verrucomicrobiota bacterium]